MNFEVEMAEDLGEKSTLDLKPLVASSSRTMVSNAKFNVEKFDDTNNFDMWQRKVLGILYQQQLDGDLKKTNRMTLMAKTR